MVSYKKYALPIKRSVTWNEDIENTAAASFFYDGGAIATVCAWCNDNHLLVETLRHSPFQELFSAFFLPGKVFVSFLYCLCIVSALLLFVFVCSVLCTGTTAVFVWIIALHLFTFTWKCLNMLKLKSVLALAHTSTCLVFVCVCLFFVLFVWIALHLHLHESV